MTHQELLKKVEWKDLKKLTWREMLIENNLTIPWFVISIALAYSGSYILALPFSAFFFLTGLRQVHNGFHNSLGTNKFLTWLSLYINSVLMLVSIHAVKFNHIRHHKYCLSEDDYEGKSANMTWYGAILYGPVHMFLIHKVTWQLGNKSYRRNMALELISIAVFVSLVFYFKIDFLIYHIIVMLTGEFLMAFLLFGLCIMIPMKARNMQELKEVGGKISSHSVCFIIWNIISFLRFQRLNFPNWLKELMKHYLKLKRKIRFKNCLSDKLSEMVDYSIK